MKKFIAAMLTIFSFSTLASAAAPTNYECSVKYTLTSTAQGVIFQDEKNGTFVTGTKGQSFLSFEWAPPQAEKLSGAQLIWNTDNSISIAIGHLCGPNWGETEFSNLQSPTFSAQAQYLAETGADRWVSVKLNCIKK